MIRLQVKKKTLLKQRKRLRNKARLRKKIFGTPERPRLVVFRSQKHIYAQLINDVEGAVIAQANTLKMDEKSGKCTMAEEVGKKMAGLARTKNINKIVFDRNGFIYHGRIKALAKAVRSAGLIF